LFFDFLILKKTFMAFAPEIYQRVVSAKMYTRFHFHRIFTHVCRKTPHQYLTEKRLKRAKALLAKEGISL